MRTELGSDWLQAQKVKSQGPITTKDKGQSSEVSQKADVDAGASDYVQISTEAICETTASTMGTPMEQTPSQGSFKSIHSPSPLSVSTEMSSDRIPSRKETPPPVIGKQTTPEQSHTMLQWKRSTSEPIATDYGVESEPFIVSSEDDPDESYLVTVAEKFLLEKDINGSVTEQLDLALLTQATVYESAGDVVLSPATGGATVFCVKLRLKYINRSKQERRYIMEDEDSAQSLCELLQPALTANRLLAMAEDRLQCLKCGHDFNKNSAKRHVRKSSFGGMQKTSSVGQQLANYGNNLAEKGTLEEALTCPQCSSDMVIEIDPKELTRAKATHVSVSPMKLGFPLATSSAQTSPRKPVDSSRHKRQTEGVVVPGRQRDSHPAYAADASFQSCVTESSASYKSTSREDYASRLEPEPSSSYKSIAKTMRATLTATAKMDKTRGNPGNSHPGPNSQSETTEKESETNRFPHMKLSDTKAWVDSNPADIVGLSAAKSNSSTGIMPRISDYQLQGTKMTKSVSDTGIHKEEEDRLSNSNAHTLSRDGILMSSNDSEVTVLQNNNSSDIMVLDSSSKEHSISSSDIFVDAVNPELSNGASSKVLRPSGSDLLILKNTSSQVDNSTKSQQTLTKNDLNAVKNCFGVNQANMFGIVEPYCGEISLAGQLSRRRFGSKESSTTREGQMTTNHEVDDDLEISMSESEPDSLMTTSESFFSTKSTPKKKSSERASSKDLDQSSNPFYESVDMLDNSNPFYEDQDNTPIASGTMKSDVLDKTNPFYEEDIEVLDSKVKDFAENSKTKVKLQSESESHEWKVKVDQETSHNHLGIVGDSLTSPTASGVSSHRTLTRKLSSDIEVLTEESASPSETVIRQNESETNKLGNPHRNQTIEDQLQLSPVGSLTDRTINDMLDFMRSSIYDSPRDDQDREELESMIFQRSHKKGQQSPTPNPQEELIKFNCEDFSSIDHRLKLHLMMNVFGCDEEEFQLLLKCGVLQYTKADEFDGILVTSNLKFYIFKITNQEKPDNISKWLKLVHSQSLSELQYLDIGLGYQSFRVEFGLEATCFDLLIREELWCKTFVAQFTALLQDATFSSQSHLAGISKNNPMSLSNLETEVVLHSSDAVALDPSEVDPEVVRFLKGFLYQTKAHKSPVSLVITRSHICLAAENHKFPPPRCVKVTTSKGHTEVKGQQFSFKDRQRVTDLTRVEVFKEAPSDAILYFMDDSNPEEFKWVISMTTKRSLGQLLDSLGYVWTEHFGVDLQITTHVVTT